MNARDFPGDGAGLWGRAKLQEQGVLWGVHWAACFKKRALLSPLALPHGVLWGRSLLLCLLLFQYFRVYSKICSSKTPFPQNLGFPCISCIPTKVLADFHTFPRVFHHLTVGVMTVRLLKNNDVAKKNNEEVSLGSRGSGTHAHFRRHSQQMLWFSHQASSSRRAADRERSTAECKASRPLA